MMRPTLRAALLALLALAAGPAVAYPDRPVRLIIPFPPGGGVDNLARPLAQELGNLLGQPFVIENRGGAGGSIGLLALARSAPDGHNAIVAPVGVVAINPHVYAQHPVDVTREIAPVVQLTANPLVVAVPAESPHRDLRALIAAVRSEGDLSYGSGGSGGISHLVPELFLSAVGGRALHVPYRGSGPAIVDLVAGRVAFMMDGAGALKPTLDTGRIRALAVTGAERLAALPGVPTAEEAGAAGFTANAWNGLYVPAGTPRPVVERLNGAVHRAVGDPAFRARLEAQGIVFRLGTPEELGALGTAELARWGGVVGRLGLRLE